MIGMWNKSVILTYVGMGFAVLGMVISAGGYDIKYAFACLMVAGVCDLFDGAVARKCKRTEDEKAFGVQLDSLVDVIDFIALPITIFVALGMTHIYHIVLYILYGVCGVARLGYYNVMTADENGPIKYYTGLPVTYSALIFPVVYLARYVIPINVFEILFTLTILAVAAFYVLKVKLVKPKGAAYAFFGLLAIVMLVLYLVVL